MYNKQHDKSILLDQDCKRLLRRNSKKLIIDEVLEKYANKDLFEKIDGIWQPKFVPGEDFQI